MKCRVFTQPDGSLLVTHFVPQAQLSGETWEQFMDRETARLTHTALPYIDVEKESLPAKYTEAGGCQRCFWKVTNGEVVVDKPADAECICDQWAAAKEKLKSTDTAIILQGMSDMNVIRASLNP